MQTASVKEHWDTDLIEAEKKAKTIMESLKARKVYVTNPLTNICGVCGAPAADVWHYGSIACYSCRWSQKTVNSFHIFLLQSIL